MAPHRKVDIVLAQAMLASGSPRKAVAAHFGVTPEGLRYVLTHGYRDHRHGLSFDPKTAQALRDLGHTLETIAGMLDVSPQRIGKVTKPPSDAAVTLSPRQRAAYARHAKLRGQHVAPED